jgi:hypothetical protein
LLLTIRKETPPFSRGGPHIRSGLPDPTSFQKPPLLGAASGSDSYVTCLNLSYEGFGVLLRNQILVQYCKYKNCQSMPTNSICVIYGIQKAALERLKHCNTAFFNDRFYD